MTFPERLKQLREEHNVSQAKIARMLKLTRQAYNNYEKGIREPNILLIKNIASYYGVSTDYVLCKSDDPHKKSQEEIQKNLGSRISIIYSVLSDSGKNKLLTYAHVLFDIENSMFNYDELFDDFYSGKINQAELNEIIKKRQSESNSD